MCWIFSICLSTLFHAVLCPGELTSMSCLSLMLGSANERRERWDTFPWFLPVMLWFYSGFVLLTSTLCILEWVKEYIEGKKRDRGRDYVLMYWCIDESLEAFCVALSRRMQPCQITARQIGFEAPYVQNVCWDLPAFCLYPFPHLSYYSLAYSNLSTYQHPA